MEFLLAWEDFRILTVYFIKKKKSGVIPLLINIETKSSKEINQWMHSNFHWQCFCLGMRRMMKQNYIVL